jgi:hypothetical protein
MGKYGYIWENSVGTHERILWELMGELYGKYENII